MPGWTKKIIHYDMNNVEDTKKIKMHKKINHDDMNIINYIYLLAPQVL